MKIYSNGSDILRSEQTRELQKSAGERQKAKAPESAAPAQRSGDKVQISDAGRAMAAKAGSTLTPERISEVRERILSGAYNSLEVVDQVARKMLASGDI